MTTILTQMEEQGFTSDKQRDWAVRQLATWEDEVFAGKQPALDADDLAMVRHEIMQPSANFYPVEGRHGVEVLFTKDFTLEEAEELKDFFYEAIDKFKTKYGTDLYEAMDVVITG